MDHLVREQGISISFYTPQKGIDDPMYLDGIEKDAVVNHLMELKKEYGDFILNSRSVLNLMKSGTSFEITSRCKSPTAILSIDAKGNIKNLCVQISF